MKTKHVFYSAANLLTFLFLVMLIGIPFYFAKNTSKVAGVKSESHYLLISQLENFPNITAEQVGKKYTLAINKLSSPTLFTEIFIINNPTSTYKTYEISSSENVFFGTSQSSIKKNIVVAPNTSVPISVLEPSSAKHATISFEIKEI